MTETENEPDGTPELQFVLAVCHNVSDDDNTTLSSGFSTYLPIMNVVIVGALLLNGLGSSEYVPGLDSGVKRGEG